MRCNYDDDKEGMKNGLNVLFLVLFENKMVCLQKYTSALQESWAKTDEKVVTCGICCYFINLLKCGLVYTKLH